jgi:hypothetical protein
VKELAKEREVKEGKKERNVILSNSVIHDRPESPTPQVTHCEGTGSIPGHSKVEFKVTQIAEGRVLFKCFSFLPSVLFYQRFTFIHSSTIHAT